MAQLQLLEHMAQCNWSRASCPHYATVVENSRLHSGCAQQAGLHTTMEVLRTLRLKVALKSIV
eukprot:20260-Heterococcus_DN1.PRE.1